METKTTVNINSIRKVYFRPKEEIGKIEIVTQNKRFFFFKTKKTKTFYFINDVKYSSINEIIYEHQKSYNGFNIIPRFDQQNSILYYPPVIIAIYGSREYEKKYYDNDKDALNVYNKLIEKLGNNIISF